jgi:dTDP-4-amino-4,6-dideoxygalactose transaminase
MYEYAIRASIGDDVFHEPCTSAFEKHIAQITGKEAALFVSSGTLSNQLAIRTHLLQPPFSILTDVRSHINAYVTIPSHPQVADPMEHIVDMKQEVLPCTPVLIQSPLHPRTVCFYPIQAWFCIYHLKVAT